MSYPSTLATRSPSEASAYRGMWHVNIVAVACKDWPTTFIEPENTALLLVPKMENEIATVRDSRCRLGGLSLLIMFSPENRFVVSGT